MVGDATQIETPAMVLNLFQGVTQPQGATGAVPTAMIPISKNPSYCRVLACP